ncbi:unnamed protein product [Gulo gulo]|uniref:Uncharacterized protein n=1 Tax=Gulo gulo TaxID=48420 RepID=A0A9X9LM67_GULGU|nr:unnamed protein product [Gulo gulo]
MWGEVPGRGGVMALSPRQQPRSPRALPTSLQHPGEACSP